MSIIYFVTHHLFIQISPPPNKRARRDVWLNAAKLLAPKFQLSNKIDAMEWSPEERKFSRSTSDNDVKDSTAMIYAISRGNAQRAGAALSCVITDKSNTVLKDVIAKPRVK